jgi:hypothetical protein
MAITQKQSRTKFPVDRWGGTQLKRLPTAGDVSGEVPREIVEFQLELRELVRGIMPPKPDFADR